MLTLVTFDDEPDFEEAEPEVSPTVEASDQIVDALLALDRHPDRFIRWAFQDVHQMTGAMAPGDIWIICAGSGAGKTTYVASSIPLWNKAGKKVFVMPLEIKPHTFRTYLGCMKLGIAPGDALTGELRTSGRKAEFEALQAEVREQIHDTDRLMVSGHRAITLRGLEQEVKKAKRWGADIFIVDHIDHIDAETGNSGYDESRKICHGALRMAQDNEMLILFTSQLNMSSSKGDALAKYMPPRDDHVAFGSLKRQVATGVIGLFRPLRKPKPLESLEDFRAQVSAARRSELDPQVALEPNTMGVVLMKSRNYGAREGARAYLAVRQGKVSHMAEADRWTTEGGSPRQVL